MTHRRNRHARRHDQCNDGDYHDQRIGGNHAGKRVTAGEYADDQQQHYRSGALHRPDGTHDGGRLGIAIAAFAQELQIDECRTYARGHGNRGESCGHLRTHQTDGIALVGIHESAQRHGGTEPSHEPESHADQRHGEIRLFDGLDHLTRLNLREHDVHGHYQQCDGDERTETESRKRDLFHGIGHFLRSEGGDAVAKPHQ